MKDLTCLFLTLNKVPWMKFHNEKMLEAIGDYPLITISRLPMNGLPGIQIRQGAEQSHDKIFQQMLVGAKMATTPYVAMVEDDMLYSKDHFELRPPLFCPLSALCLCASVVNGLFPPGVSWPRRPSISASSATSG